MKVLIYSVSSLLKPHLGVLLDEAEILNKEGHEVKIIYCDNSINYCFYNPYGSSLICKYCQSEYKRVFKKISNKIKVAKLGEYKSNKSPYLVENYNNVEDIKKLKYKDVEIGYSSLSLYITLTRNHEPEVDKKFVNLFDKYLYNSKILVDLTEFIFAKEQPDQVVIFNARMFDNNAFYKKSILNNIQFVSMEVKRVNNVTYKEKYYNSTPHDTKSKANLIFSIWDNSILKYEDKLSIGKSFFEKRRDGIASGDKVYTKNQKKGLIPNDFDTSIHNIAIFNSSEDEVKSLGSEFENNNLFKNQIEGIEYILESFKVKDNYHFYLRIHPNLKGLPYKYHTDLYLFADKYKNITIISPEDNIDSYSIMDACEKVIVFNSTMGIESVYWGKPVIVLNNAFYYYLNGLYIPNDKEEIIRLIQSNLYSKDNLDAIKYGFYIINYDENNRYRYVNFDKYVLKVVKFKIITANYQKYLGSRFLFSIRNILILFIDRYIFKYIKRKTK